MFVKTGTHLESEVPLDAFADGDFREAAVTNLPEAQELIHEIAWRMRELDYPEDDIQAVRLLSTEAIANAIHHGHGDDPTRAVVVRCRIDPDRVVVVVKDHGPGFDPRQAPDPTADENLERVGGRGIMLMNAYADWIERNDRGNEVTMCRRRSQP